MIWERRQPTQRAYIPATIRNFSPLGINSSGSPRWFGAIQAPRW